MRIAAQLQVEMVRQVSTGGGCPSSSMKAVIWLTGLEYAPVPVLPSAMSTAPSTRIFQVSGGISHEFPIFRSCPPQSLFAGNGVFLFTAATLKDGERRARTVLSQCCRPHGGEGADVSEKRGAAIISRKNQPAPGGESYPKTGAENGTERPKVQLHAWEKPPEDVRRFAVQWIGL